ncbi:MAG: NRDE family protein, partial [Saprospiraceae bacterium]
MCTVTYYPTPSGFILTHNRDEAPTRSPQTISRVKLPARTLLFPRDTKAGGAWIVATNTGQTACLLNGAFVKHHHAPPYRRSRGLLLLDCMEAERPPDFVDHYDYTGIEPFTLLFISKQLVRELRWDGLRAYHKNLPIDQPHFWCSATLYAPAMQQRREQVYRDWLPGHRPRATTLLTLHREGSVQDPQNDFVMNRADRVRTVSITQVVQ